MIDSPQEPRFTRVDVISSGSIGGVVASGAAPTESVKSSPRLVILRTHLLDARILDTARSLRATGDYRVVLALDERVVDGIPPECESLTLSRTLFQQQGLLADLDDVLWRCGDYPFYLARAAYPDAEFIWQYEYDVVFNDPQPASILRQIDEASTDDLVTSHLREPEPFWFYKDAMEGRYNQVYRCYFPLTRLSARAIDFLWEKRKSDTRIIRLLPVGVRPVWPNDEAFVATELVNNGFLCKDINDLRRSYNYETFWSDVLRHPSELPSPDGMIYHAVRTGDAYAKLLVQTPWIRPRPSPAQLWRFIGKDASAKLLRRALRDSLEECMSVIGDDTEHHSSSESEIVSLLRQANNDEFVIDLLFEVLIEKRMFLTINWLRRHLDAAGGSTNPLFRNLAIGMPAWQNSTSPASKNPFPRIDALGGNNGVKDIDYGFHTGENSPPFWAVDLLDAFDVEEVILYNRREHWERLENFRIKLSMDGIKWSTVYENDRFKRPVGPDTSRPIRVSIGMIARFVKVDLPVAGALHLREVEVLGRHRHEGARS